MTVRPGPLWHSAAVAQIAGGKAKTVFCEEGTIGEFLVRHRLSQRSAGGYGLPGSRITTYRQNATISN
ncbi:MAG: hypothetical protein ACE5MK_05100 [Acidobacteriota bacterium]